MGNHTIECFRIPSTVSSFGIWERLLGSQVHRKDVWEYTLPHLEIVIVFIFFLWQSIHFIGRKIGSQKFASQLIAGLILSRTFIKDGYFLEKVIFPKGYRHDVIDTIGSFGFAMFWFMVGLRMDLGMVTKTKGKPIVIGVSTILFPAFVCGYLISGKTLRLEERLIMIIQNISTFSGVVTFLTELKIQNSELGRLAISSTIISDILGATLLALVVMFGSITTYENAFKDGVGIGCLLVFAYFVYQPATKWIIRNTPEGRPVKNVYIYAILIMVFATGLYAKYFDQSLSLGVFILGIALPNGSKLALALIEKVDSFVCALLVPLFVVICGSKAEYFKAFEDVWIVRLILVIFVAKFLASLISSLILKMPIKESLALSFIIVNKGLLELSIYFLFLEKEYISEKAYATVCAWILINSIFNPIFVKLLYNPSKKYANYKKKAMIHMKLNSDFKIISCIHKPDNIDPMINLIEASCPTKENNIIVYVIHLIELIGQVQPLFITHHIHKKKSDKHSSRSDNVIVSFGQFQRDYWGMLFTHLFTSISSPKHMHEDVNRLACDKETSLILLPFHRTWLDSVLVSDNPTVRDVNRNILKEAPCTVGILLDRSKRRRRSSSKESVFSLATRYKVCVFFLGGKDDREALIFAKRMTRHPSLSLTVVRFFSGDGEKKCRRPSGLLESASVVGEENLDDLVFDELRNGKSENGCVNYVEENVEDGTKTSLVVRSMVNEFDLIIVGKGEMEETALTEGLGSWCEFEELGIIGDLCQSFDVNHNASVLVIQHPQ